MVSYGFKKYTHSSSISSWQKEIESRDKKIGAAESRSFYKSRLGSYGEEVFFRSDFEKYYAVAEEVFVISDGKGGWQIDSYSYSSRVPTEWSAGDILLGPQTVLVAPLRPIGNTAFAIIGMGCFLNTNGPTYSSPTQELLMIGGGVLNGVAFLFTGIVDTLTMGAFKMSSRTDPWLFLPGCDGPR